MAADEAVSISAEECNTAPLVPYAREITEDTDVDNEAVNLTPGLQIGFPQLSTDDPSVEGDDYATMAADEAVSISAEECNTAPLVPHAREITEDTDVDNEAVNLTPGLQIGESRPLRSARSGSRKRCLTQDAGEEDASTHLFLDWRHPYSAVTACKTNT
ncbi:hypothetical protein NDU88_002771 [Pleurodeles waltl]|uniref:Uncharacterized protein n=1 Tax=Pleurodeles waltl TaxID=8319 RepID=A0AAV7NGD3_PLEWA|nr:hypothetical protein NDU88_002771 [Pleurodeles waltl]